METNMKAGGYCSLSGVLRERYFKTGSQSPCCQIMSSLPQWSDYSVHPKELKSGNVLVDVPYLACSGDIWSGVHMSAFFSGRASSFLISWPDTEGTIALRRPNRPKLFFSLQCFPGGCHSGTTTSRGRCPAAS